MQPAHAGVVRCTRASSSASSSAARSCGSPPQLMDAIFTSMPCRPRLRESTVLVVVLAGRAVVSFVVGASTSPRTLVDVGAVQSARADIFQPKSARRARVAGAARRRCPSKRDAVTREQLRNRPLVLESSVFPQCPPRGLHVPPARAGVLRRTSRGSPRSGCASRLCGSPPALNPPTGECRPCLSPVRESSSSPTNASRRDDVLPAWAGVSRRSRRPSIR